MKILLIDRDLSTLARARQFCRAILADELKSLDTADSYAGATVALIATSYDIILLGLSLSENRAAEFLATKFPSPFQAIVISDRPEDAMRAFDYGVMDFIPKNFTSDRLARALHRGTRLAAPAHPAARYLAVRRHGRIDLVAVDDLLYVEGADKYSNLVCVNGRHDLHDKSLSGLEAVLPSAFVRIHRSYLVRLTSVSRLIVREGSRYYAELKNGTRLPVGRSRFPHIKSRFI